MSDEENDGYFKAIWGEKKLWGWKIIFRKGEKLKTEREERRSRRRGRGGGGRGREEKDQRDGHDSLSLDIIFLVPTPKMVNLFWYDHLKHKQSFAQWTKICNYDLNKMNNLSVSVVKRDLI